MIWRIQSERDPLDKMPWDDGQDEDLQKVYEMHSSFILDKHQIGPISSIYNFPLGNAFDVDTLMEQVNEIYKMENNSFKVNLTFGIILQNRESKEYRYFKPYKNDEVFQDQYMLPIARIYKNWKKDLRNWT